MFSILNFVTDFKVHVPFKVQILLNIIKITYIILFHIYTMIIFFKIDLF